MRLTRGALVDLRDLDELRALTTASLHRCRMELAQRLPFRCQIRAAQACLLRVSDVHTSAPLLTWNEPDPRFYNLVQSECGVECRIRGRTHVVAPGELFLYSPEPLAHRTTGEDRALVVRIPAELIEREVRLASGEELTAQLEIREPLGAGSEVARALVRFVRQLNRPARPALDERSLRPLARELVSALVASSQSVPDGFTFTRADRRILARAENFMEADLASSMSEVAEASDVSLRTLEYVFRRLRGRSPIEMRCALRLDEAMRRFKHPNETTTVSSVAHALGFTNVARFAALYEQQFHERPIDTLRRGRGAIRRIMQVRD